MTEQKPSTAKLSVNATTRRDAGEGRQIIQDLATFSFDVLMDDTAPRLAIMGSVSALRHMQARAQEVITDCASADVSEGEPQHDNHCAATDPYRLLPCDCADRRDAAKTFEDVQIKVIDQEGAEISPKQVEIQEDAEGVYLITVTI